MQSKSSRNIDIGQWVGDITSQFQGLDKNDPGSWPALPRYLSYLFASLLVLGLLWYVWLSNSQAELAQEEAKELTLKTQYQSKLAQAVNLEALKKQREQVLSHVRQLEKQLPSKAEMDALLSDINQAGLGRSLQFELFRPGQINLKEYYAELPIALKVTGNYHDIGAFVADIANLSRIVTLNNLAISPVPNKENVLAMESTAKTFRYLDSDEVLTQRQAKEKEKASGASK